MKTINKLLIGVLFFSNVFSMNNDIKLEHDGKVRHCRYDKGAEKFLFCVENRENICLEIFNKKLKKTSIDDMSLPEARYAKFNENNSSMLAYQKKDNTLYVINKKGIIFKEKSTVDILSALAFFGKSGCKLFNYYTPHNTKEEKYYQLLDVETGKNQKFNIDNKIWFSQITPNGEDLLVYTYNGLYHCNDEGKLYSFGNDARHVFDKSGKNFIFFNADNNTFNTYNLKLREITNTVKVDGAIANDIFITSDDRVFFTIDGKDVFVWDITAGFYESIKKFDTQHRLFRTMFPLYGRARYSGSNPQDFTDIMFLSDAKNSTAAVYDAVKDEWFTIELPISKRGFLTINKEKTYAAFYCYSTHEVYVYSTENWKTIKKWRSDDAFLILSVTFSFCGNFVEFSYQKNKNPEKEKEHKLIAGVALYDIKNDKIVLQEDYYRDFGTEWNDNFIAFIKPDVKTLCLFNYKKGTATNFENKDGIDYFTLNQDFVSISCDNTTTLYPFNKTKIINDDI